MDEITKTNTSLVTSVSKNLDPFRDFDKIQKFAESLTKSEIAAPLRKQGSLEADPADIIAAISIGIDIGIPPISAISLGKTLNAKSYLSVLKGRSMGIDPITSITKIHNISTDNGDVLYTAVDVISKVILDTNTRFKIIRDYELTPKYYILGTDFYVGHKYKVHDRQGNLLPQYFLYSKGIPAENITKAIDDGKIVITQGKDFTYVTSIHFIREEKEIDEIFHYSTQEATDAKLLNGYHSSLKEQNGDKVQPLYIKGKSNWNYNTPQMLRNRCISIAGRIIVADKLQGIYSIDEVRDMENVTESIEEIQTAEEIT